MAVGQDNWCRYQFNPTELYQRGAVNESHCGKETFQAYEDYEEPVKNDKGEVEVVTKTRLRSDYDPHCPEHGGTKDPSDTPKKSAKTSSATS